MIRTRTFVIVGASALVLASCAGLTAVGLASSTPSAEPVASATEPSTTASPTPEPSTEAAPSPSATAEESVEPLAATNLRGDIPVEPGSLLDQLNELGMPVDFTTYTGPTDYPWNDGEAAWHCRAFLSSAEAVGDDEQARSAAVQALLLVRINEHTGEPFKESGDALVANVEHCTEIATGAAA